MRIMIYVTIVFLSLMFVFVRERISYFECYALVHSSLKISTFYILVSEINRAIHDESYYCLHVHVPCAAIV